MKYLYALVLVLIAATAYYLGYKHADKPIDINWEYKIDSLQNVIDSIKVDTTVITELEAKLDTIYVENSQSISFILSASDSVQLQFFSDYLQRFPSIDN